MNEDEKKKFKLTEDMLNEHFSRFVRNTEMPNEKKKPEPNKEPKRKPFIPYNTMFKLNTLQRIGVESEACGPRFVECVACGWGCELESVLIEEVHDYQCPECLTTTWEYYKDIPYREVNNAKEK